VYDHKPGLTGCNRNTYPVNRVSPSFVLVEGFRDKATGQSHMPMRRAISRDMILHGWDGLYVFRRISATPVLTVEVNLWHPRYKDERMIARVRMFCDLFDLRIDPDGGGMVTSKDQLQTSLCCIARLPRCTCHLLQSCDAQVTQTRSLIPSIKYCQ